MFKRIIIATHASLICLCLLAFSDDLVAQEKGLIARLSSSDGDQNQAGGEFVVVESVNDLDDLVVKYRDERIHVALAAVGSFSTWSTINDVDIRKLRDDVEQYVRHSIVERELFLQLGAESPGSSRANVYLSWTSKHVSEMPWNGKNPSQQVGWGMTSLNVLMVEKGWSTPTRIATIKDVKLKTALESAKSFAKESSAGVWRIKKAMDAIEEFDRKENH